MTKSAAAKSAAKKNTPKTAPKSKRTRSTKRPTPTERSRPIAPAASITSTPHVPNKQEQLAALLLRDEGASLDQMVAATGWLPHTTRAAMTGLKKKGYVISSEKLDGRRTYRAIAPQ